MHVSWISRFIYSVRYYLWFHITAVGLGTYYPRIQGSAYTEKLFLGCTRLHPFYYTLCLSPLSHFLHDYLPVTIRVQQQHGGMVPYPHACKCVCRHYREWERSFQLADFHEIWYEYKVLEAQPNLQNSQSQTVTVTASSSTGSQNKVTQ